MKNRVLILFGVLPLVLFFQTCTPETVDAPARIPILPAEVYAYDQPPGGSAYELVYNTSPFGDSLIDNYKATLGRVLFYETQLSKNNRTSCATCHIQQMSFADGKKVSEGFHNLLTPRNTPALLNTGTQQGFFWDLRELVLDHMVLQPIFNPIEMGLNEELMVDKIRSIDYYRPLFAQAFGDEEVNQDRIGNALAQFIRSIVTINSRFDQGVVLEPDFRDDPFPNFTEKENLGKFLFFRKLPCSTCHGGVNLDGSQSFPENVGLEMDYKDDGFPGTDPFTGLPRDGWFKTPSLRNIELTAPYMHDGRFATLEQVVEFYNSGIHPHEQLSQTLRDHADGGLFELGPNIPDILQDGSDKTIPLRMFMSEYEKSALVAFLKTLTDKSALSDPKFSDPFVEVE